MCGQYYNGCCSSNIELIVHAMRDKLARLFCPQQSECSKISSDILQGISTHLRVIFTKSILLSLSIENNCLFGVYIEATNVYEFAMYCACFHKILNEFF